MEEPDQAELMDRFALLERMVAEGRHSTERWGWSFILWGIAPLVGIWCEATVPRAVWAWPVTIGLGVAINGLAIRARKRRAQVASVPTRSLRAIWTCTGVTVLLFTAGAAASGISDYRLFFAALFALPAVAHGASGIILRWPVQWLAAMVWWSASLAAFVVPADKLRVVAMAAIVLGNIAFGIYLTYRESSRKDG